MPTTTSTTAQTMPPLPSPLQLSSSYSTSLNRLKMSSRPRRSLEGTFSTRTSVSTVQLASTRHHQSLTVLSASAVARVDNLEFLADVVPKTVSYKEHKAKKQREEKEAGQTTLPIVASTATATATLPTAALPAQSDPVPAPVQAQLLDPMDETS